jgi:hypothetical protein
MSINLSRRSVLAGGASLVAVGSVCALAPPAAAVVVPTPLNHLALRRSTFLPLIGQAFQIAHDRGSLTVILRRVSDLNPGGRPGAEHQFSLFFTDARIQPSIPQGTYCIRHARRGRISLFVVPVGRRKTPQQYQAIITSRH